MSEHEQDADGSGGSEEMTETSGVDETASVSTTRSKGLLSRRGALAGLASLGLLGAASSSAAASNDHNHLGQTWFDNPSATNGLKIKVPDTNGLTSVVYATDGSITRGLQGKSKAKKGRGVVGHAYSNTGNNYGVYGRTDSDFGVGVYGQATNGSGNSYGVRGETNSPSGYGVYTSSDAKVGGVLEVGADLKVTGKKNFVQAVETSSGTKEVAYTSIEAGNVRTEASDVAEMENGRSVVELPTHFDMVTSSDEDLTVHITPYAKQAVQPQVVERSTDRIVVEDFGDGPDEYSFAYTVKGIREGFEDQDIVQDP